MQGGWGKLNSSWGRSAAQRVACSACTDPCPGGKACRGAAIQGTATTLALAPLRLEGERASRWHWRRPVLVPWNAAFALLPPSPSWWCVCGRRWLSLSFVNGVGGLVEGIGLLQGLIFEGMQVGECWSGLCRGCRGGGRLQDVSDTAVLLQANA